MMKRVKRVFEFTCETIEKSLMGRTLSKLYKQETFENSQYEKSLLVTFSRLLSSIFLLNVRWLTPDIVATETSKSSMPYIENVKSFYGISLSNGHLKNTRFVGRNTLENRKKKTFSKSIQSRKNVALSLWSRNLIIVLFLSHAGSFFEIPFWNT